MTRFLCFFKHKTTTGVSDGRLPVNLADGDFAAGRRAGLDVLAGLWE